MNFISKIKSYVKSNLKLRDYQNIMLDAVLDDLYGNSNLGTSNGQLVVPTKPREVLHVLNVPTGLGKTTLLQKIAVGILKNDPDIHLILWTAPTSILTNEAQEKFYTLVEGNPNIKVIGPFNALAPSNKYEDVQYYINKGFKVICVCDPIILKKDYFISALKSGINQKTISFHDESHYGYMCPGHKWSTLVYGYLMSEHEGVSFNSLYNLNIRESIGFTATPGPLTDPNYQAEIRKVLELKRDPYYLIPCYIKQEYRTPYQPINLGIFEYDGLTAQIQCIEEEVERIVKIYQMNWDIHNFTKGYLPLLKPVMFMSAPNSIKNGKGLDIFDVRKIVAKKLVELMNSKKYTNLTNPEIACLTVDTGYIYNVKENFEDYSRNGYRAIRELNAHDNQVMFIIGDRQVKVGVDIPNTISIVATIDQAYKIEMSSLTPLQLIGRAMRVVDSKTWSERIKYLKDGGFDSQDVYDWLINNYGYKVFYPKHNSIAQNPQYKNRVHVFQEAVKEFETEVTLNPTEFRKYVDDLWYNRIPLVIEVDTLDDINVSIAIPTNLHMNQDILNNYIGKINLLAGNILSTLMMGTLLLPSYSEEDARRGAIKTIADFTEFAIVQALAESNPTLNIKHEKGCFDFSGDNCLRGDVKLFTGNSVALGTHYDDFQYVCLQMDKNIMKIQNVYVGAIPKGYVSKTSDRAAVTLTNLNKAVDKKIMTSYKV